MSEASNDALLKRVEAVERELAEIKGQRAEADRCWSAREFAAFLGVSTRTVYRMERDGEVEVLRIGGEIRITPAQRAAVLAGMVAEPGG